MTLREKFNEALKTSMKAGDADRTSTLRMILARLKDVDIAARPKGIDKVSDDEILTMLRSMMKSRRESIELYKQGNRPELAAKEAAEIMVIQGFMPTQLTGSAVEQAVTDALAETGATSIKDMVKVMAALKLKHGSKLDLSVAGPVARDRLNAMPPG